ncbi:L-fucose:H+ symporter permease [Chryseolinea lacunae]|uniref:L-fucose:H+ symporter permease n=1 Tax=Chryseolinea lacunae TaxID=2801331 RepID=A0ABS1L392_9BACT|nr:L-fucose:H+ symporter permease [Chryseolinea lacunae]MBL0745402.1 L-fucose:H+ symporter permease [Chryseolinea lacunae]
MPILNTNTVQTDQTQTGKSYLLPFILVTSLFFLWGLANSLNGTLIKHFQTALNLNRAQAGIVDSAFYIGYFVMALPAGLLMNRIGYKKGILIGLFLYAIGAFLFYPAAEMRVYGFFLFALFVIACGLAFLETAANPYVTVLGNPATADSRINFSQSFNGLSIILGPVVGSLFIFSTKEYTNEMLDAMPTAHAEAIRIAEAQSVQFPYLVIAGIVLFVAILFAFTKMPEISTAAEKEASFKGIFRHRHLVFGVVAQFFYVGAQASLWGYFVDLKLGMAKFENIAVVEWLYRLSGDMTPTQIASFHASFALVLFMIGRFVGTWLLTKFKAHSLLAVYAAACVVLLVYGLLGEGIAAIAAITCTYFFMSIMFPTIFALSVKNLGDQVKLGAGLVIMAIVGGAVLPPLTGQLSQTNMQHALYIPLVAFIVIFFFGVRGYKVKA